MQFIIDLNQATRKAGEMKDQKRVLVNSLGSLRTVKANCSYNSNARLLPISAINRIINEMNNEISDYDKLINTLNRSVECYRNCERRITNTCSDSDISFENGNETNESVDFEITSWANIWDLLGPKDLWDVVSEAGIIGAGISAIGNIFTAPTIAEKVLGSGEFISKVVGNAAEAIDAGADWSLHLLGLNNAFGIGVDGIDTSSSLNAFKSTFRKECIDDLTIKTNSTTANKVGVAAKWAGHAINLATNAFENYREFEDDGAYGIARGSAETIIETGVDIGLGVLATAAVSAGAVALGVTAAPAVVIGGISAAAVVGANALCKWVTGGKDIGEVVADGVCNIGEAAINVVSEGCEKAAEAIGNIGEAVGNGISSAWSGFCDLFA